MNIHIRLIALGVCAAIAAAPCGAIAQEESKSSGLSVLLEEIVVTSRKIEESLQDAPLAVSAFSGESLEVRGFKDISEIGAITPNMTYQSNPQAGGSSSVATVYIRGVGQRDFLGTIDNGVGFYIDDVYVARTVGATVDLVDVDRVEVLRGPQGTLFGRNSVGGAMALHSKRPGDAFGGDIEVGIGTDSQQIFGVTLDAPLSDDFRTKFSIKSNTRDGYVSRPAGGDLGDDDVLSFRAGIDWDASDSLQLRLNADYSREEENGPAFQLTGVDVVGEFGNGFPGFYNNVTAGATCGFGIGGITSTNPLCYNTQWVSETNLGTAPTYSDTTTWGLSLHADWSISDSMTLKSITAIRDLDAEFARDADASPITIVHFFDDFRAEQFSQEFQLLGSSDKMDWILGLYYFDEDVYNQNVLEFAIATFDSRNDITVESKAAFAQGTYHFSENLDLTVGVRYTDEEKTFSPNQVVLNSGIGVPPGTLILPLGNNKATADEFSPLINLAYTFDNGNLLYASYSEGFRSGGFVQRIFPPQPAVTSFAPEFVTSYEMGFKVSGLDNALSLNGALFAMDYDDIQVRVPSGVAQIEANVGTASISGVELELKWQLASTWFLEASLGYTDASYDQIVIDTTGLPDLSVLENPFLTIQEGNEFDHVPEWNGSISLNKQIDFEAGSYMVVRLGVDAHDGYFNDPLNLPQTATPSVEIWGANAVWTSSDESMIVNLGIKNLTDEKYQMTGYFNPTIGTIEGIFDRGRIWSLSAKYRF